VLAALSLVAVAQALVAVLGGAGRLVGVALVALGAAASLISTTPPALAALAPLSPVTPALDATRAVLTSASPGGSFAALLLWLLGGLAVTALVVARRRTVRAADVRALAAAG